MLVPMGFFTTTAAALVTPTLGAATIFARTVNGVDGTVDTWTGHSSTTGSVLARALGRVNSNPFVMPAVTWGRAAVTQLCGASLNGGQRAWVWIGVIRGGLTGAQDLVATFAKSVGDYELRLNTINNLPASYAGAANALSTNSGDTNVSTSITTQGAASLMVGVGGPLNGAMMPLGFSAGWSKAAEARTGTAADTTALAAWVNKVGSTAGLLETNTWTAAAGTGVQDDWACAIAELKAG
jgi:hypothetical protein